MKIPTLGYACINNTLAEKQIVVNRSMIKKTFQAKGIAFASETALKNVTDLTKIIRWNISNGISLYRMSSDMFPWMSEYEFDDLPDIGHIRKLLARAGTIVRENAHRLTFHPGPFNVLASPNESVVEKTIKELRQHGEIMDMLDLPRTPFAKINIHVGGAYGDKTAAIQRFIANFKRLPDTARLRLTVENDDKANMFSVNDLMRIHDAVGIPIVFDYLHHQFCTGDLTEEEALELAVSTWPKGITPIVHFSSARKKYEDRKAVEAAHADFIYSPVKTYGHTLDVMFEAKAKEAAVEKYINDFSTAKKQKH